jgi:hypothetical protein
MTPRLTEEQKQINKTLTSLGYLTFKTHEYTTDRNAMKLLELFNKIKQNASVVADINFIIYIYYNLSGRKLANSQIDIDTETEIIAISIFYGINNLSLATKILNRDNLAYSRYCDQDENGVFEFDDEINNKLDSLISYSKLMNVYFKQYKNDEAIWSLNTKAKKDYINNFRNLLSQPLFKKLCTQEPSYTSFLKQNIGLNQIIKTKATYLLSLKLPNVSSLALASNIIRHSKFFL